MAADETTTPDPRPVPLAPLPDHRNVHTPWWQELWSRHAHVITPLRARGLPCDIEFGLSAYIVRVSLPDDSYLVISPPHDPPPSDRPETRRAGSLLASTPMTRRCSRSSTTRLPPTTPVLPSDPKPATAAAPNP